MITYTVFILLICDCANTGVTTSEDTIAKTTRTCFMDTSFKCGFTKFNCAGLAVDPAFWVQLLPTASLPCPLNLIVIRR